LQRKLLTSYNMSDMGEIRNAADESQDLKWWKPVGDLKLYWRTALTRILMKQQIIVSTGLR
jgi:hypothetical protein